VRAPLQWTRFENVQALAKRELVHAWPAFVDGLRNVTARSRKQDCPLLKLARFGEQRSEKGSLRHDANLVEITGIEADYDGEQVPPDAALELLERAGIKAVIYTSPSHRPDAPRWRVVAPLALRQPPERRTALLNRLNGALGGILAAESWTLSQTYYFGRVNGAHYRVLVPFDDPDEGHEIDTLDELDEIAVGPPETKPAADDDSPAASGIGASQTLRELRSALAAIPADDRGLWVRMGHALKELGDRGRALWIEWSQTSDKYEPADAARKWASFRPERTGYAAVFAEAQRRGWVNPAQGGDRAAYAGRPDELPPEPEDIFQMPRPPILDLEAALPPVLRDFARDHAHAAGHDPGAYAYAAVCAASSVLHHTVRVQILPRWIEPALLWVGLTGSSGSGKSPAMNHAVAPVLRLQNDAAGRYAADLAAWEAAKDADPAQRPKLDHYYFANATIEAVIDRMADCDHQALRHADEGTAWLNAMGRYAQNGGDSERGDWLAAWNGAPYTVARIKRGDRYLPSWSIAVLYGITPEKMKGLYAEAASDGLLARTLVYLLDRARWVERNPFTDPTASADAYGNAVRGIATARARTLHLTAPARELWQASETTWRNGTQLLAEVSPGLSSFLGKAPAMLARVAGLFHLLEGAPDHLIGLATMQRAVAFLWHAGAMARIAHMHLFAKDDAVTAARRIAAKVLTLGGERITRRDLAKVTAFQNGEPLVQAGALRYLAAMNWLLGADSQRIRTGPRFEDATAWRVNPLVYVRFADIAERCREERGLVHALLAELGRKPNAP
jgi:hypothetical protein